MLLPHQQTAQIARDGGHLRHGHLAVEQLGDGGESGGRHIAAGRTVEGEREEGANELLREMMVGRDPGEQVLNAGEAIDGGGSVRMVRE